MKVLNHLHTALTYSYYALFLLTPLLLTKFNYELFEFNKMIFVYAISVFVALFWISRMIIEKRIVFKTTIIDIPVLLFFTAHIISTITSIDPHVSLWGYYGRFNGGVISLVSYLVLYYGFVSNFAQIQDKLSKIKKFIFLSLFSATIVASYGIAQHYGIDADLWVQDVERRVFSTLGQPNWLAAYINIMFPITLSLFTFSVSMYLTSKKSYDKKKILVRSTVFAILAIVLYTTLLYTKSRSGFIAFWVVNAIFWVGSYLSNRKYYLIWEAIGATIVLVAMTIAIGSPIQQLNNLIPTNQEQTVQTQEQVSGEQTNLNITDSGDIRILVWKTAIDASFTKPLFGWGPETFAWVFYQFKPIEHNLTSEWDFLYNKAHNEYFNYLATTGFVGLGSYLAVIGLFAWWSIRKLAVDLKNTNYETLILTLGLFTGWISLLITNFFGFSVVTTSVYFWLIPAFIIVINTSKSAPDRKISVSNSAYQWIGLLVTFVTALWFLFSIVNFWWADYYYAEARSSVRSGEYTLASRYLFRSLSLNPYEPTYHSYLSNALASLAVSRYEQEINNPEEAESDNYISSDELVRQSIKASDTALGLSPGNVSFMKTRTRMFYTLSQIDEKYTKDALSTILQAQQKAPNDPTIAYNTGIVYELNDDTESAIQSFKKALSLKPDYRDAAWALAIFYEQEDNQEESKHWLNYILKNIDPNDAEVKNKLGI